MKVSATWHRFLPPCGAYLPAETEQLDARQTPRLLLVTFPRGHVQRLKRFDRLGREQTQWKVWQDRLKGACDFYVDIKV